MVILGILSACVAARRRSIKLVTGPTCDIVIQFPFMCAACCMLVVYQYKGEHILLPQIVASSSGSSSCSNYRIPKIFKASHCRTSGRMRVFSWSSKRQLPCYVLTPTPTPTCHLPDASCCVCGRVACLCVRWLLSY